MKTVSQIKELLEKVGGAPKKSLGQNFLINPSVVEKIVNQSLLGQHCEAVIEIGPGLGALTESLLQAKTRLQVVELDRAFAQYWRDRDVDVIEKDALKLDWAKILSESTVIVSNLPYQISSSLVIELSVLKTRPARMVLMFQKEVAQRIQASVAGSDYGLLSVVAQSFWDIQSVVDAGPRSFYPPPKVASRVLCFEPLTEPGFKDPGAFLNFVKIAFSQRRKKLASNLQRGLKVPLIDVQGWFTKVGLDEKIRPERVRVAEYQKLFDLAARKP